MAPLPRVAVPLFACAIALATARGASADPAAVCDSTQGEIAPIRESGDLLRARAVAAQCVRSCAAAGDDKAPSVALCKRAQSEIDADLPAVKLEALGLDGEPAPDVSVTVDDTAIPGGADQVVRVNPGARVFRFTLMNVVGVAPIERRVEVQPRSRDTVVHVSFADAPPPPAVDPNAQQPVDAVDPAPSSSLSNVPIWAWIVGGTGAAALIPGGVLLGLSVKGQNDIDDYCPAGKNPPDYTAKTCADGSLSRANDVKEIAGGVLVGVGAAAIITGIIGIGTAPRPRGDPLLTILPIVDRATLGLDVSGSF